jgi:16S rRNA (cytosine1402-N4)-methyltransferase
MGGRMANSRHIPVMLTEVIASLAPQHDRVYIDATFGAGGYSTAILSAANCKLHAFDRDENVIPIAEKLKNKFANSFEFHHQAFAEMEVTLADEKDKIDGIVFDIGVSSMQIDSPERGFSFQEDGILDMRMDSSQKLTATYIVNHYNQQELADIFYNYGGEKRSRAIAKAIVLARQVMPIERTKQLANIIQQAVPNYNDSINPATRSFQALRIVVNDELGQLQKGLLAASKLIAVQGKIVVVTFHSLEDRIVKNTFKELTGKKVAVNKYLPSANNASGNPQFITEHKGVLTPSSQEIAANPRARSAKLRVLRRVG